MCIRNRMTAKERKAYLVNKPDIIKVWKVLGGGGHSCFGEIIDKTPLSPMLLEPKIHHARTEPKRKRKIDYKPGFHCYITEQSAKNFWGTRWHGEIIGSFFIRKSWITEVGTHHDSESIVYVSKKITPDRSLLEGKVT